jgi:hypothetical protein
VVSRVEIFFLLVVLVVTRPPPDPQTVRKAVRLLRPLAIVMRRIAADALRRARKKAEQEAAVADIADADAAAKANAELDPQVSGGKHTMGQESGDVAQSVELKREKLQAFADFKAQEGRDALVALKATPQQADFFLAAADGNVELAEENFLAWSAAQEILDASADGGPRAHQLHADE